MKICIIGLDFAAIEERVLAMALNHGVEVECIHSHEDVQALFVNERVSKEQMHLMYGSGVDGITESGNIIELKSRQTSRSASYQALYAGHASQLNPISLPKFKQEPHWVIRNAKNKRY